VASDADMPDSEGKKREEKKGIKRRKERNKGIKGGKGKGKGWEGEVCEII
jgi:hypothetical protein